MALQLITFGAQDWASFDVIRAALAATERQAVGPLLISAVPS
jgi:hypothetical protein